MSFETPSALLLSLIPAAVGMLVLFRRSAHKNKSRAFSLPLDIWGGPQTDDAPRVWKMFRALSVVLYATAWVALSIAVAGPASRAALSKKTFSGTIVVFVLDVSPSMAAKDMQPSRMEAAKRLVHDFVSAVPGASVGIIAFGSEAALLCPPTTDYSFVLERLDSLRLGVLGDGTAIAQGLAGAYRQIHAASRDAALSGKSIVILLTDGEDNVGLIHPHDAADALASLGVHFIVAGIGSQGDIPIEYVRPDTGQKMSGAYHSDFSEKNLETLAVSGNGVYCSVRDEQGLSALRESFIKSIDRGKTARNPVQAFSESGRSSTLAARFFAAALILAGLAWGIRRFIFGGIV